MRTLEFTSLSNDELVRVAKALQALAGSPGWKLFMDFLKNRRSEVGLRALEDDTRPREYWQGFRDGCDVERAVADLVAMATEAIEDRTEDSAVLSRFASSGEGDGGSVL